MSILEEKKIVIRLPQLDWKIFLNFRFLIFIALIFVSSVFAYWYHAVRPFFWISSARVEAFSTTISSDVAGRIIEVGPQEGERIKKGQMLFALDRDLILAKQTQAKFILDSLEEQIEREKERIEKAMDDYLTASAELEMGIGSADLVKKQLSLMEDAQKKSEAAHSQLAGARIELAQLDLQIKKMTLAAPFSGIVLKQSKNAGAVVSFGDPVYVLCDPDRMWIEAEVPETRIGQIALGSAVRIQLPSLPNKELNGKVAYIGPATVSKSSQLPFSGQKATIPIKVSLETPDPSIKPGLSARIGLKIY